MIDAAVSAAKPLIGWSLIIFEPIVRIIRHPPDIVPSAIASAQDSLTHNGTVKASLGKVSISASVKDRFGIPVANVHYDDHPNDIAMREHAYKQGTALYEAVGALKTHRVPPYPSTHNMGTCRMSLKEADGVCNKYGQSHEVPNLFISDGSQFTTSAAENPTLTIVSLAIRQADYIAESLKTNAA